MTEGIIECENEKKNKWTHETINGEKNNWVDEWIKKDVMDAWINQKKLKKEKNLIDEWRNRWLKKN